MTRCVPIESAKRLRGHRPPHILAPRARESHTASVCNAAVLAHGAPSAAGAWRARRDERRWIHERRSSSHPSHPTTTTKHHHKPPTPRRDTVARSAAVASHAVDAHLARVCRAMQVYATHSGTTGHGRDAVRDGFWGLGAVRVEGSQMWCVRWAEARIGGAQRRGSVEMGRRDESRARAQMAASGIRGRMTQTTERAHGTFVSCAICRLIYVPVQVAGSEERGPQCGCGWWTARGHAHAVWM